MANERVAQSSIQILGTQPANVRVAQSSIQLLTIETITGSCNSPQEGTVGQLYNHPFTVVGGLAPYTWSIISGSLPPGITLNTATGAVAGTPTTPGSYVFTVQVVDSSVPQLVSQFSCSISINPAGQPLFVQMGTLRFEIPKKRWFPITYDDSAVVHYLDEVYLTSVDNLQLLQLSRNKGFIYREGGDTDNGAQITSTATIPSLDGGDDRILKLYIDIMTDADNVGTLNATAFFNNQTIVGPTVAYTFTGPRAQQLQNISSLGNLNLYRNIAIQYQWTGGPDGPRVYISEPAGYAQPYVSTFFVTQIINLSFPGWKHHRRLYAGYISNTPILFKIQTQDGRLYGPYSLPSTGGVFQINQIMLDQAIKDLAFGYQIDGQGFNFVLFPEAWSIETKEWTQPSYIPLAIFKT